MPDTNDGPAGTVKETEATAYDPKNPMPGFAEAFGRMDLPPEPAPGEPEGESAVETSAEAKAPDAKVETPAAKPESTEAPAKPDAAKTVNFDGLSDDSKAYWENALTKGYATPADVERARKESLFQAAWTRNNMRLAKEREAFEAERAKAADSLSLIEKIRSNPALEAAVKSVLNGEATASPDDGADFISRADAERIAQEAFEKREREKQERTSSENAAYVKRQSAFRDTIKEQMTLLGVDGATMKQYLAAEEQDCAGDDPILALTPKELAKNLQLRHEAAQAKAEAAALREQVSQRASKQVQTSKQSLPPDRRVAPVTTKSPMQKALDELGLTWDQVPGLGFHNGGGNSPP